MRSRLGSLVLVAAALGCLRPDDVTDATGEPIALGEGRQPQIAVAPSGAIDVAFARGSAVFWTRSVDGGGSFSAPSRVGERPDLKVGMRRGPRIAATDERLVVTAPGRDLVAWISDDGGKGWSAPLTVNDAPGSAAEGLHNLTALPDGSFFAAWLDSRSGKGARIEGSRLERGAKAWSRNVEIYASPDGSVCQCCHPSIAAGSGGELYVLFRNSLGGNRDPYLASSRDGGKSFAAAVRLGGASWALAACPMDGGGLIVDPERGALALWRRQREILLLAADGSESKLGEGTQPVLAKLRDGVRVAWQEGSNVAVRSAKSVAESRKLPGRFPSLAASPDGRRAYLVVEASRGKGAAIEFTVVP
jgi:hypothetical protein